MTGTVCGCSRPVHGAYLCGTCTRELRATLILAASIAGDLQDAVARQLTRGSHGRQPGKPEPPLPFDPHAAVIRARLLHTLDWWSVKIADRTVSTVAGGAITISEHMNRLRQNPEAWNAKVQITAAFRAAETVLDRPPERVYAGPCPRCGADVLGSMDSPLAQCECGACYEVAERQEAMRMAFRDLLFTVPRSLTMMAAVGHPVSEFTMRSWIHRKRLRNHGYQPSPNGREPSPLYRLGDVMDLEEQNPRRKPRETSALVAGHGAALHTDGRIAESGSRDAP